MRIIGAGQAAFTGRAAARLTGKVVDVVGRKVAGARVQACSGTVCVPAVTDDGGTFVFPRLAPGTWSLVLDSTGKAVQVTLAAGAGASLDRPLVRAPEKRAARAAGALFHRAQETRDELPLHGQEKDEHGQR
jgi:hypothetical protein